MTTAFTPAPESLQSFVGQLCTLLPVAAQRTLAKQFEQLLSASQGVTRQSCFQVGSMVYFENQVVWPTARVRGQAPALPRALLPAFKAWQQPFNQIDSDIRRIKQALSSIVISAKSWQDVRNMFPDRLLEDIKRLGCIAELQRTAPDLPTDHREQTDVWGARLCNLYEQVNALINLYLGYKLL